MSNAASANLRGLAADLTSAGGSVEQTASHLIDEYAQKIAALGQSYAPYRTGALKESIGIRRTGALTVEIGPTVDYGAYQEFGTGSKGEFGGGFYDIRPKSPSGLLAFEVNGRSVYARKVRHPGVKGKAYMRRAFSEGLKDFLPALAAAGCASITKGPRA